MSVSLLICFILLLPAAVFALLGVGWLLGWSPQERTVARLTSGCYGLAGAAAAALWVHMGLSGTHQWEVSLGNWFAFGDQGFPLLLRVDRLSMPLVMLSIVLVGIIGVFSARYLHREAGYLRFFTLLHLFAFGILLLFLAGSFDLVVAGWELVGITSVILIAFFHERAEPVENAIRVFATYRACDIGLLTSVVMLHHFARSTSFSQLLPQAWPGTATPLDSSQATLAGFALLLAAMGKAAQIPFSGWLPRAMEGPTPSSAIFYGALSVHAGAYLLLRAQPILAASPWVSAAVIVVGLLTAIHGTMVGRACADAKTSLAYASMSQLGIIFVEIGLGWSWLALFHICGHAVVRTLQFLRAPSMLHDYHRVHSAAGGQLADTGSHLEMLFPAPVRLWLYRLALDRGHHDTILDRFIVGVLVRIARRLMAIERAFLNSNIGTPRPRPLPVLWVAGRTREGIDG